MALGTGIQKPIAAHYALHVTRTKGTLVCKEVTQYQFGSAEAK
jgi:hypothetical protein